MAAQIRSALGDRNDMVLANRDVSSTSGAHIVLVGLVGLNKSGNGVGGYGRIQKRSVALQLGLAGALGASFGPLGLPGRWGPLPVSLGHQPKKAHTINATTAAEPTAT